MNLRYLWYVGIDLTKIKANFDEFSIIKKNPIPKEDKNSIRGRTFDSYVPLTITFGNQIYRKKIFDFPTDVIYACLETINLREFGQMKIFVC